MPNARSDRGRLLLPGFEAPAADAAAARQMPLFDAVDALEPWQLRRSERARRLTARVFVTGRVEIVVPQRASERRIREFVHEHRAWIERKVAAARARQQLVPVESFPPATIELRAFGESWRLHLAAGVGAPRVSSVRAGLLTVRGEAGDRKALQRCLVRWLSEQVRRHLEPELQSLARTHDLRYSRLAVRRQRTRWGSCSRSGTISVNACLAFQRPEVVRYLLLHELAHTRHMNHSARFWDCVAGLCADWQALDRELSSGWRNVPQWVFA
jgi:predicted metal-dependent hydrolase